MDAMFLGIDLGSSGVKIAIITNKKELIHFQKIEYCNGLEFIDNWSNCCEELIKAIPLNIKSNIKACSVDGTSGTILACNKKGIPLGKALPYYLNFTEHSLACTQIFSKLENRHLNKSSFLRALELINRYGINLLLRHQADWINGWLTNNWQLGEEGNNLKLGWDIEKKKWPESYKHLKWENALPKITRSGEKIGLICPEKSKRLGLPIETVIYAGTTDSNAAVIASGATEDDGITVLGSTIVVKRFVVKPIKNSSITNHRILRRWIAGGSSNAGGKVLNKFFTNKELIELSKQINPHIPSGLKFYPLLKKGERFPINDPNLKPILEPRPISDSLFLHGMLEGLARIEAQGWQKLIKLGAPKPKKIITLGGGSNNPQWNIMREKQIKIPIHFSNQPPAYGAAIIAMKSHSNSF